MGIALHIGRVGALAVALGVGAATVVPAPVSRAADTTALIMCGTTCPTPDAFYIESAKNQFIGPTHPDQDIDYVPVTTPEEFWPLTGVLRLLVLALGPANIGGLDGPAWPDEPLWKLSGLFDLTANQSLQAGAADLDRAVAENGNDNLVILGWSQGAGVANVEKRSLAEQYPVGTEAPDIDFVLIGDPNLPNGGLMSRFPGLYIPILDLTFNGPARTDTQFDTVEIYQQYDGFTDFPLYPLNVVADLNAVLGVIYVHTYLLDNSLPADPTTSSAYQGTYGDTSYYFFDSPDLPLFGPLRTLGVPEPVIDVVEPFFRVVVELGYDRSIPSWEPTPARLIPTTFDPGKVTADLVDAVGEGIDNAAKLIGAPAQHFSAPETIGHDAGGDDVSEPLTITADAQDQGRELTATNDRVKETIGAVKSVIGNGRTTVRSAAGDGERSDTAVTKRAHKTPVRDAVAKARSDIKKAVTNVSDNIKSALSGSKHIDGDDGDAE